MSYLVKNKKIYTDKISDGENVVSLSNKNDTKNIISPHVIRAKMISNGTHNIKMSSLVKYVTEVNSRQNRGEEVNAVIDHVNINYLIGRESGQSETAEREEMSRDFHVRNLDLTATGKLGTIFFGLNIIEDNEYYNLKMIRLKNLSSNNYELPSGSLVFYYFDESISSSRRDDVIEYINIQMKDKNNTTIVELYYKDITDPDTEEPMEININKKFIKSSN